MAMKAGTCTYVTCVYMWLATLHLAGLHVHQGQVHVRDMYILPIWERDGSPCWLKSGMGRFLLPVWIFHNIIIPLTFIHVG